MATRSPKKITHAAVGIIQRENGDVLLAERPEGKPWSGYWEFPGGKVEAGETPQAALVRELDEELGIGVTQVYPWMTRTFDYPAKFTAGEETSEAKTVKLYFFVVTDWDGEPQGLERQQLCWQSPEKMEVSPMLPANTPIFEALKLPRQYALSHLNVLGEDVFFAALKAALEAGLKMIVVAEPQLDDKTLLAFAKKVIVLANRYQAEVTIQANVTLAMQLQLDGVHYTTTELMLLDSLPKGFSCSATCDSVEALQHAAKLNLDYVFLAPVVQGGDVEWGQFNQLIADYPLPVYALGSLTMNDLHQARMHRAHGLAYPLQA
jgi:8-oxo-dGTP diphosphatase